MKKLMLLLGVLTGLLSVTSHAQDKSTPEGLMHHYVKVFNEENLAALQDVYHFPHVKIVSGTLTRVDDPDTPVIDFADVKKTGWKYSKINSVKVLAEGSNAALVELDFSRFNAEGKEYLKQISFYNLTRNKGYWQIISIHSMGALPGVKTK